MNKQCKRLFALFFIAIFLIGAITGSAKIFARAENLTSAKGMCVMEINSNRVLYSKNKECKLPMASTTKIVTAITAIENCEDLDKVFKISPKAIGISGTSLYLKDGEQMSMRDLLYGLMLVSGNDASVAIGEAVCGSVDKFVSLMNKTAYKIGAFDSHFENTHGLDSKSHYTTAYDLALITSYAMKNQTFKEIVSTKNTKITNSDGKTRYLKNKNKLLNTLDGCCGVKTGFTDDAGRCLVSCCERNGMSVVCVVLNCGPMFEESGELLDRAFNEYNYINLTSNYAYYDSLPVIDGKSERVEIGTFGSYYYPLRADEISKVRYEYNIIKEIKAPVDKGIEVGEIKIFIDKDLHFTEKVYTIKSVRRNSVWSKVKDFIEKW